MAEFICKFTFVLSLLSFQCKVSDVIGQFANGADIGWLSQMESSGRKFYDSEGKQQDLLNILKSKNINSVRLRVWVNPANGWCGKDDVVKQAVRAKAMGFRIMIDFHYSDSWADPGQQNKPAAWKNYTFSQLTQAVYSHTYDVLSTLKSKGVDPEWVQIGNETNNGMLWEDGRASKNMQNFAQLINSGYNAVKAVNPSTKVIVHIANGYNNSLFRWMFDGLKTNAAKWDVIGMSLYPDQRATATSWQTYDAQCFTNMNDMVLRYGKEVMLSEIGMDWSQAQVSYDFITDIIKKTKLVNGGKGLGVFYWEPESFNGWNGYQKGAFDNAGRPTKAMDAFKNERVTSIEEDKLVNNKIIFYPNPFSSFLNLNVSGKFEYTIYDSIGNQREIGTGDDLAEIAVNLPSGIYMIIVRMGYTTSTFKVTKE